MKSTLRYQASVTRVWLCGSK